MTISVELETTIARQPADIHAALVAVERFPEWLIASGIAAVERLDEGPLAVGSRVRISQQVAGRATKLEGSITELQPDKTFGLRGRDPDGVTIEIAATLTPDGAATRLRWSLKLGLPLRFRMFESMVSPQIRRAVTLDVEAFRRRLEAAPLD